MNSTSIHLEHSIPALDLAAQYKSIEGEIKSALFAVLEAQHFILGPNVKALEEEVSRYCERSFGVGVASGTDALILALRAAGIGPGDEVIVPSFSFIATADSVSLLGAVPVFVDIDADSFCIQPAQIEEKINQRTKAIIPVHIYGHPAEMDAIMMLARQHKLLVIEDNAQAIGATYKRKRTTSFGDIGCLSFFPSKNLGGFGDGGMIVTNSEKIVKHLRSLRAHGATKKYYTEEQGWNSRLDEIQAAILRVKLRHLDAWSEGRRERAAQYDRLLGGIDGVVIPRVADDCQHVYHQYTIRVPKRDRVQKMLADLGIASTVYYPTPIHLQPIYAGLGYKVGDLPETEKAAREVLSLPIYPELTDEQLEQVAQGLDHAVREA
jgi:UDP-N-acetyl-3-dehydro-alpha-D-glucosamine 3-aminotranferase